MNTEEAEAIVRSQIEKEHALGEGVGGSGHLGHTSLRGITVEKIEQEAIDGKVWWTISYTYSLVTETEFTYYPDNPPHTSTYTKKLTVSEQGRIKEAS